MGERNINPIQNIHSSGKYKEMIFINPYSFGNSLDADAQVFITASGITDNTQKVAINQLVLDLKSASIWTKMKAIYPFVGGTASSHKWNLKDPRDLDVAFRLVFNGGWVHGLSGAKPNGTTGYALSYLVPFEHLTQGNSHLSYYSTENITNGGSTSDMGGEAATGYFRLIVRRTGDSGFALFSNAGTIDYRQYTITDSRGHFIGNIIDNDISMSRNGAILTSISSVSVNDGMSTVSVAIGANNASGVIQEYSNKNCAFASIGDGLTTTEHGLFYNAVQAFQTTLNRQV